MMSGVQFDSEFVKKQQVVKTTLETITNDQQLTPWDAWMNLAKVLQDLRLLASKDPQSWKETEREVLQWLFRNKQQFTTEQGAAFDSVWAERGYADQWNPSQQQGSQQGSVTPPTQRQPPTSSLSSTSARPPASAPQPKNPLSAAAAAAPGVTEMAQAEISSDVEGTFSFSD